MASLAVFVCAVVVLCISDAVLASCPSDNYINGCSVPGNLNVAYKKRFTPACNKHDVCYYCGQMFGWTRDDCDSIFLTDMRNICEKTYSGRKRGWWDSLKQLLKNKKSCKNIALAYYGAVRIAGSFYWAKKSPAWCTNTCAKNGGNPNHSLTK